MQNGQAMPGRRNSWQSMRNCRMLFRRGRDRNRAVGQRGQIADHVGALAVFRNTGKAHRGAGDETLRTGDELVEVVEGPGAAFALHGCREIKAAASFASVVVA